MRKMQSTTDLFHPQKNVITKQINAPNIEKLKKIYEVEGNT